MQKENLFFFSFPSAKDSKLVSLGSSKKFGEAKILSTESVPVGPSDEKSREKQKIFFYRDAVIY